MAYVISDDCIACGTCIDECPVGAISEGDIYSIDPETCTECGTCADVCPSEAIHPGEYYNPKKKKKGSVSMKSGLFISVLKRLSAKKKNIHLYLYWSNPLFA